MVDAGDARIHVDLDASTLGSKLTEAVNRALRPALAEARRQVAQLNAELNKVKAGNARDAAKAFEDVAASAKSANEQVRRYNDVSGRMRDSRGRFVGAGGGGGGGRPPPWDGSGQTGGFKDYSGVLGQLALGWDRLLSKLVLAGSVIGTLTPLIGALGGAIGVLGGGIGVAIGGIGQLTAGITGMVPAIIGAVAAIKIGFDGLKDGAKAYMKQFDDANAVISAQIGNMMGPMLTAWQQVSSRIKLDFAQALVPTFNNLAVLLHAIGPQLSAIGQAFGGVANSITAQLLAAAPQINQILEGSKALIAGLEPGLQQLTRGFLDIGASASKAMPMISAAISAAMTQVGQALSRMASTPEFQQALSGFAQGISAFGGLLAGLIPTLTKVGAMIGPLFADMITALGPALNQMILAFGQLGQTVGPSFIEFLTVLGPVISQLLLDFGRLGEIVGPYLGPLLAAFGSAIHSFIEPLGQAGALIAQQFITLLPTVGQVFQSLIVPLSTLLPATGTLLNFIGQVALALTPLLLPLGQAIGQIANALVTGLQPMIPVINQFATALAPFITELGQTLSTTLVQLGPILTQFAQDIIGLLLPALPTLLELLRTLLNLFVDMSGTLINIPGLVQAVVIAFVAFETIQGVGVLGEALVGIATTLGLLPAAATTAGAATAVAGEEMAAAFAPVTAELAAMPAEAEIAGAGITAAMTEADAAVISLGGAIDAAMASMSAFAVAAAPFLAVAAGVAALMGAATAFGSATGQEPKIDYTSPGGGTPALGPDGKPLLGPDGKPIIPGMGPATTTPGGPPPGTGRFAPGQGGPSGGQAAPRAGPTLPGSGYYGAPPPGGAIDQTFAGPQPFTPVAPDLKGGGAPGQQKVNPEDLPIDMVAQTPEQITLLTEIRNLLNGTGTNAPLNTLKDMEPAVQDIANTLKQNLPTALLPPGSTPGHMGPFGTPIPARNLGYEAAANVLQALGVQNVQGVIGPNPIDYATQQWGKSVDQWQTQTDDQIKAWQQFTQQNPLPMSPQQMGALPGMPQGWQATNLPPPGPPGMPGAGAGTGQSLWDMVAAAESGTAGQPGTANWQQGGPGHFGGLQFDPNTWTAFGGVGRPQDATREQQIEVANRIAFTGWQGNPPQGLSAWTTITGGKVPGVTAQTPASAFGAGGAPGMPGMPGMPTAPGLPGMNIATGQSPIPVWVVGMGPIAAAGLAGGLGTAAPGMPGGMLGPAGLSGTRPPMPPGAAGMDPRDFAHNVMMPYWQSLGLQVGDHAADKFGEHQHGALDVMVPNLGVGQQVLQQALQDPNVMGAIFNNQTFGYGHGLTPQDYTAGHTGDPSQDHLNHVHIWYQPGNPGDITPGAMPAGFGAGMPGMPAPPGMGTPPVMPGGMPSGMNAPIMPFGATPSGGTVVPVYVTNWPGQQPGSPGAPGMQNFPGALAMGLGVQPAIAGAAQGLGQVTDSVGGDIAAAIGQAGTNPAIPRQPDASLNNLIRDRNPLALAAMAGLHVEDFTRQGGPAAPGDVTQPPAQGFTAQGQVFSDTASLIDRTFTSLAAQIDAMRQQLLDVLNQVKDQLSEQVLGPIVRQAVQEAFNGISSTTLSNFGTQIGGAAAVPIANAVQSQAPPTASYGAAIQDFGAATNAALFDEGGDWPSGTYGVNLSGSTERVLSPSETALWDAAGGGSSMFATVSGVTGNATVGSDFFGVSQVPIIGAIVNMLVQILLKIIGVNIDVRDTLGELSDNFRQFRGDAFKAFDAQGRLISDTSGLIDRSISSEQTVVDERVRILKQVIDGLIKYIIDKVVVPLAKAVGNALVQAAASAAGAGAGTFAPGTGGIVNGAISGAGQAIIDMLGNIGIDVGNSLTDVLVEMVGQGAVTLAPNLINQIFSGANLNALMAPLAGLMTMFLAPFTTVTAIAGTGSGSANLLGFDTGGMAYGSGLMPKTAIAPERVLSTRQTAAFERLVDVLDSGSFGANRTVTIHAPFTVDGSAAGAEAAHDRLLKLMS